MDSRICPMILLSLIVILAFAPQVHARGYQNVWALTTLIFFTDADSNPLLTDQSGSPMLTAVLSHDVVKSTNPGQVLVWIEVQHIGFNATFQSTSIDVILPPDWIISPAWPTANGAIHVYFANTTTFGIQTVNTSYFATSVIPQASEITQSSNITASAGEVHLLIPNFNTTAIGHPLNPYQSILLAIKVSYSLKSTAQSALTYPRKYVTAASSKGWIGFPFYPGSAAFSPSACYGPDATGIPHDCFFTAYS